MPHRNSRAAHHRRIAAPASHALPGGFKLFGVRLAEPLPSLSSCSSSSPSLAMRKSVSLGNLSSYGSSESAASQLEQAELDALPDGYASDDLVHTNSNARERKKGVPWTEEEHRRFLLGLQKLGKGDWRGISRSFVKTRTPTQVASHAQKYFLRQSNLNKRRRRSSLFDIIPETGDGGTEALAMEAQAVWPLIHQLNLGHGEFDSASNIGKTEVIPIEGVTLMVSSAYHDEVMEEAGEEANREELSHGVDSGEACNISDEDGLKPFPSAPGIDSTGLACNCGDVPNHTPFFQLLAWPTLWRPSHSCPDSKIVKPTPIIPPATEEFQRTTEPGPVMKPSALSYKLSEDSSRQSAFHSMPSGNHAEMDTKESVSSAISVA